MSLENTGLGDEVTFAAETCPRTPPPQPSRSLPVFLPAPIWRDAGQKGRGGSRRGDWSRALLPVSLPGGPELSFRFAEESCCQRIRLLPGFPESRDPVVHKLCPRPCAPPSLTKPCPQFTGELNLKEMTAEKMSSSSPVHFCPGFRDAI